jgi:hypothetical protein
MQRQGSVKTLIIVVYIVVLVFFTRALYLALRRYIRVKRPDVLALFGLILMALLYGATLVFIGGALLSLGVFHDLRSLYLLLLVIFLFSMLYHWTSPTFPFRKNRPILVFMGIMTTISLLFYLVLFYLAL